MIVIDSCTAITAGFTMFGAVLSGVLSWAVAWWFYTKRQAAPLTSEQAAVEIARINAEVSKATIWAQLTKWMVAAFAAVMITITLGAFVLGVAQIWVQR